jgi:hypothetical protein
VDDRVRGLRGGGDRARCEDRGIAAASRGHAGDNVARRTARARFDRARCQTW